MLSLEELYEVVGFTDWDPFTRHLVRFNINRLRREFGSGCMVSPKILKVLGVRKIDDSSMGKIKKIEDVVRFLEKGELPDGG